jgi:hypothetical protein
MLYQRLIVRQLLSRLLAQQIHYGGTSMDNLGIVPEYQSHPEK